MGSAATTTETRWNLLKLTGGIHRDGPVHQVQVNVIQPQTLKALIKVLFDAGVVGRPKLCGDKYVVPLNPFGKRVCEPHTNLAFIPVRIG